ncbi:MAG: polyribonucleotide nucleotidyltransferase [Clostridiales bacterium]|nr:MAG: polyribonucleotide nucleotidyltransferase [Clostridiales bacterium]
MSELKRNIHTFSMEIAGRTLTVECGRLASLANGSAKVSYGDTVVLATATASKSPREGIDFFPLSVEYEEKMYSVGKIPGGFLKREGRASEKGILTSRLIDRPIRPLFPDNYFNEVQIIASVLSVEQDNTPDMVAMIGASIALSISDIPFEGPIAGVNVGYVDGKYIINPTVEERNSSKLSLAVAGTHDAINMVEAGAEMISEKEMLDALMFAHKEIQKITEFISEIKSKIGKPKNEVPELEIDENIKTIIDKYDSEMKIAVSHHDKMDRAVAMEELKTKIKDEILESVEELPHYTGMLMKSLEKKVVRKMILEENLRPDGRTATEIRPIISEVGIIPRTHGSGLFTRGLTQALSITTLGALGEAQRIDGLGDDEDKRYMHHYNFPPFSVGETGPMRGPNRRAIGHGALGERALLPVLPSVEEFPYAIRVVSEVLACNGSSSQASICGSSLSLMDAGVPISDAVAGIAMGLIAENGNIEILSDIQGMEDFLGDMDFKVAGTKDGITAMQMDIKIKGLSEEIFVKALEQARIGRLHILGEMNKAITKPNEEMSKYAPRVISISIHPDKIRDVIGPGGKMINSIIDQTGVKIDIDDNGLVLITAPDGESGLKAKKIIESITTDVEVGQIYEGMITRIMKFGAFVDLGNGKEGLCHISQLTKERLEKIEDKFTIGDEIKVKVMEIDNKGRINLSSKVLL